MHLLLLFQQILGLYILIGINLVHIKILISVKKIIFTDWQLLNPFTLSRPGVVWLNTIMELNIINRFLISLNDSFFQLSLCQFLVLPLIPHKTLDLFIFIRKCI